MTGSLLVSGAAAAEDAWEPLVLRPGVTQSLAEPETWTVDLAELSRDGAMAAADGLSSRLYGPDRPALHAPLVLLTDFPEDLVIGFRVSAVSLRGATLEASVTGATTTEGQVVWEPAASTIEPNTVYYAELPAGPQRIELLNAVAPATGNTAVVIPEYWIVADTADLPADAYRAPITDPGDVTPPAAWRSQLYPADWAPVDDGGSSDADGRFLHDFSYAGYHRGERPIPDDPPGDVVDVTAAPYGADDTGTSDATAAIQRAVDDVGAAGGGVVYLPAGTYRVAPADDQARAAIQVADSGVVIRGAGRGQTRLVNTETNMRFRSVVRFSADDGGDWYEPLPGTTQALTADAAEPTRTVTVADASGFSVGDDVVVRSDNTAEFVAEHGMTGQWDRELPPEVEGDPNSHTGPAFAREVTAVDAAAGTITLDAPTRYHLLRRDNARIYRIGAPIREVGVEDLSIGMLQNTTPGTGTEQYTQPGTGAYEMHRAAAIWFRHAADGWARRIDSFRPSANTADVHLLSNGVKIERARTITLRDVDLADPQYRGGGGNGYLIRLRGSDILAQDATFTDGRHNISIVSMYSSGNVMHRVTLRQSPGSTPANRFTTDFHQHLSMSNLFDSTLLDGDVLQAQYRRSGTIEHGHTTSQSVLWNTRTTQATADRSGYAVASRQFGHGYVVGTSGAATTVQTNYSSSTVSGPQALFVEDWREGVGTGELLEPQSLYLDQLTRRLGLAAVCGNDGAAPATVVIGGIDTGVAERDTVAECGIAGLIDEGGSWSGHGDFVRHAADVTARLVGQGVLTVRERQALIAAAARSRPLEAERADD